MVFLSFSLTVLFIAMKAMSIIDWHWVIVVAPIFLDAITLAGAKIFNSKRYLDLMLCNPLKIKSVLRSSYALRGLINSYPDGRLIISDSCNGLELTKDQIKNYTGSTLSETLKL